MSCAPIRIRPVSLADADVLYRWLNMEDRRSISLVTQGEVAFAVHVKWLEVRLADKESYLSIAECSGTPCGQLRIDKEGEAFFVSIYIDPQHRQSGVGASLIQDGRTWLAAHSAPPMRARVKKDNDRSLAFFRNLGFELAEDHDDYVVLADKALT